MVRAHEPTDVSFFSLYLSFSSSFLAPHPSFLKTTVGGSEGGSHWDGGQVGESGRKGESRGGGVGAVKDIAWFIAAIAALCPVSGLFCKMKRLRKTNIFGRWKEREIKKDQNSALSFARTENTAAVGKGENGEELWECLSLVGGALWDKTRSFWDMESFTFPWTQTKRGVRSQWMSERREWTYFCLDSWLFWTIVIWQWWFWR